MKRLGNIYEKFLNIDLIKKSVLKTSRGRRKQPRIKKELERIDCFAKEIKEKFEKLDFNFGKIIEKDIIEGSKEKPRHIAYLDSFKSQCMLAVVFDVLADYITKRSYSNAYGSLPNRGIHKAKRFIERWLKTDYKHTKYFCKADIKHCFPNVYHDAIKQGYRKLFKDKKLIMFLDAVVDSYCDKEIDGKKYGVPIGFLSSPWLVHILLTPLDFIVKQKFGIKHYIRFMDDFILLDSNKRKIKKAIDFIDKFISQYGMWLKSNMEIRTTDEAPFDYIGFKFYRDKTVLRKSIADKIKFTASKIKHKYSPQLCEARKILSYNGWLIFTSSHNFFKRYVKPFVCIKSARKVVSEASKSQYEELQNANNHKLLVSKTS